MMFSPISLADGRRYRATFVAAVACLVLAGCSGGVQEFTFHPIDEIPQGAGLITDQSGEFTIVKWDPSNRSKSTQETTVSTPVPQTPPSQTVHSTSGITEAATPE